MPVIAVTTANYVVVQPLSDNVIWPISPSPKSIESSDAMAAKARAKLDEEGHNERD
jgi:hypothetical protein